MFGGSAADRRPAIIDTIGVFARRLLGALAVAIATMLLATPAYADNTTCDVHYGATNSTGTNPATLTTLLVRSNLGAQTIIDGANPSGVANPNKACGAPWNGAAATNVRFRKTDGTYVSPFNFTGVVLRFSDGATLVKSGTDFVYTPGTSRGEVLLNGSVTVQDNGASTDIADNETGTLGFYAGGGSNTNATNATFGLFNIYVTVVAPPTINSVNPVSGPTAGTNSVTIAGTNFSASGNSVTFGGTAATVTAEGATSITVTVPGHAAGAVNVVVTTAENQTVTAANGYTYVAAPSVTALTPTAGPTAGTNSVVITGTGFTGATVVKFGANPATSFVVNDNMKITATAPMGTAGATNITVTSVGGTSATGAGNLYTYTVPITNAVTVGTSPIATGASSQLTFTLTNPAGNPALAGIVSSITLPANVTVVGGTQGSTCGGTVMAASGTISLSGGALAVGGTCTFGAAVTSAAAGTYSIPTGVATSSTTAAGVAGTAGTLVVQTPIPSVTGVAPAQGTTAGGTAVTITGSGFTGTTAVTVGGNAATGITVVNDTQITATTPGGTAGAATVVVTNAAGTSTINGTFTYLTPPTANSQSVAVAYQTATTITLTGTGATSYTVTTAPTHGTLSGTAPNLTYTPNASYSGPDSFTFTTTNGSGAGAPQSAPATVSITVQPAIPSVTGVSPAQGTTAGGTLITITGSGFTGTTAVTVGGNAATGITVVNDSQITATTPGGTAGAVVVRVTNATGTSTTNGTFTYVTPPTANSQSVAVAYQTATMIALTGTDATSYAVTTAPQHGTLSGTAPNLTYTPAANYRGADSFAFTTSNGAGTSAPATVSITIGDPTLTLNGTPPGGTRGAAYSFTFTTSGGSGSYTYAETGALPAGLTLAANGTLSGTPAASGSFPITVTVTDASLGNPPVTTSGNYTIVIAAPTLALAPPAGGLPGATVGAAYSQTISASGGTSPYTYALSAGALPAGVTLSAGGTLSGTPTQGGNFSFTITATDSSSAASGGPYAASAAYTLAVAGAVVTVAPATLPNATVGSAYGQTLSASGGTAPYTYALTGGALPTGLALSSSGMLSGTPTAGGSFTFTVTATDASTGTMYNGSRSYTVSVGAATVSIAPATLPAGTAGAAYSQTLAASGGTAPYTYAITAGALPAGLTLSSAGTLSGTPTASGSFTFSVTATDSSMGSGPYAGTRSYTLTIAAPALTLAPATLAGATVATAYSQVLTASGGTAPYTYAVTAGALPAGLVLSTGGTLSGTPTAGGSFTFTVTATDATAPANGGPYGVSRGYTLAVAAPQVAIAPAALPGGTRGIGYSQTLTASGGTAPYTYAITAGALPAGLTLSTAGTLSGTPVTSGSFTFSVTATDSSMGSGPYAGTRSYTLAIAAPAPTLALSPSTLSAATVGTAYSQTLTASGGTSPYTYAVTAGALPAGVTLSAGGVIAGTPTAGGSFSFTVTATDATSAGDGGPYTVSATYTLAVTAPAVTLAPAALPGGNAGAAYSQTLAASGGTAPYTYAITAGALPAGLALAPNGALSGTPTASGSFTFSVTATDASTGTGPYAGTRSYTLTIAAPALTLAPATLPAAAIGTAYSQTLSASGGTAPYAYAVTAGALPAGLTLSPGGTLSGTPTAGGSFAFTITATDATAAANGGPYSVSAAYTLAVAAPSVSLAPAALPAGTSGTSYSQAVTATGGIAPYTYAVTAGALPAGLTLSTAGTLSGVPTASGSFTVAVTATDSSTGSGPYAGTRSYTLTIAAPALTLAPATLAGASVGTAYSQAIAASGGTAPYSYAVTGGALPAGVTLSPGGVLSGTPTAGGSFPFTVTATDATTGANGGPYTASASYTLAVAVPVVTLAPASLPAGNVNAAYSQTLTASGGTAPYSYAISGGALPAGLTLSRAGTLSGTPTVSGTFTVAVSATDASTGTGPFAGTRSYTLSIAAPPPPVTQNAPQQTVPGSVVGAMQSVSVDLGALVSGSYTDIQISTQPQHGTVTIGASGASRFVATFTPAAGFAGTDGFGFVAIGQGGRSAEARVAVTVVGAVPVAPTVRGTTIAGQPVVVDLTATATGGPFTAARIVSISPADAVAAELVEGGSAGNRTYQLRVTPGGRFSGTATVQYTLSNAFGASAVATATITVAARPDPAEDADVGAVGTAQVESTRRFAATQTDNFMRRTEQLHGGGSAAQRSPFGITVGALGLLGPSGAYRPDQSPVQSDVLALKMEHATAVRGAEQAATRYASGGAAAMLASRDEAPGGRGQGTFPGVQPGMAAARPAAGGAAAAGSASDDDGARKVGSVALWSGGAVTVGTRDATTRRARLSISSGGLSAGADVKLADTLTIGAGGGYGSDRTKIGRDETARVDGDSYVGAVYGSYAPTDGIFLDAVVGAGHLGFDSRRLVAANTAIARGSRDGSMVFASLAGGLDRTTERFTLSIYGRANFLSADLDAYRENGAGLYDLAFAHRDLTSLSSTLGARGGVAMGAFTPRARFEWRHEFNDTGVQALDYADLPGYTYRLRGDGWLRDAISAEIGIGYVDATGWHFGVDVGGEFGSGARAATGKVTLGREF